MNTNYETIKQTCRECGEEFDAKVFELMGVKINPREICLKCYKKNKEAEEKQELERQKIQEKQLRDEWRFRSGIPPRFIKERFETFNVNNTNKKFYDICLDYAQKFNIKENYKSLGLISRLTWGVGKSHLICSVGHKIIDNWVGGGREISPVYYITESQLFIKIRGSFNRPSEVNNYETEQEIYKKLCNVPLLIVDDVGKEEVADPRFVQRVWFNIVNERYDNLKPIVIAANLEPDEIANHLGGSRNNEATFDRLYEMLGGVFYQMTGKSYRRRETK